MLATSLFLATTALAFYIILVYPLLLALWGHFFARPVRRERRRESVSAIIPVYNGERYIADKLRSILALEYPRDLLEILVVSDGSTDSTESIAEGFTPLGVRLLKIPRGGKCAALNAAIPQTKGAILLLTDVRQTLAPDSLQHLVDCFADPSVGVASGELIIRNPATQEEAQIESYWRYESWIRGHLSSLDSIFGATGPFYAIRRELAVPIPVSMLLDDMYLPLSAFFRGYRLVVERSAHAYDYPTSLQTEFRRKVRTLAGNYQVLLAYPALLGPGNRMWFHFVSYKLGRLLLPWLVVLATVASAYLPAPWRLPVVAAEIAFYFLAAVDPRIPAGSWLQRLSSPANTFVTMMAAGICALSVLFVPAQRLWKVTSAAPIQRGPGE